MAGGASLRPAGIGRSQLARYGTDCYAYAMIAAGHVDIVVEVGLQSYDIVALIPIIEKAGGVVTNWDGGPAENGGEIVAAARRTCTKRRWSAATRGMSIARLLVPLLSSAINSRRSRE